MKNIFNPLACLVGIILILVVIPFTQAQTAEMDIHTLRLIAIHHDARNKPLDTYARETLRQITSREKWSASKAPHPWLTRDPMINILSMLFEPEEWKKIPVIHLDNAGVKEILGIDKKAEWISYQELRSNPGFKQAFNRIIDKQRNDEKLNHVERKVGDLHSVLNAMDGIFSGMNIQVVPLVNSKGELNWLSLKEAATLPENEKLNSALADVMNGFLQTDVPRFNQGINSLAAELRKRTNEYPSLALFEKELTYNSFKPFRKAWIYLLLSAILFAISMGMVRSWPYLLGWITLVVGFVLCTYGLYLRIVIAGRPPVSNMYESVVYMGWGILLFAAIFELIYKQRIFGLCGAAMGVVVLILADMLPFDPAISPLVPVLRSNYWLIIHVMTIVISYSAFGLAMAIAHLSLGLYLFASHKRELISTTNNFVYRSIQIGVLLLAAGTILGGVWANESWGRFWGWDPKETWALISLLGYLALMHARYTNLVGPFGTAVGSIFGFQLILMTWYGVNFILGTGLHSYGFGAGGTGYVVAYLAAETLFMVVVAIRYKLLGPEIRQRLAQDQLDSNLNDGSGPEPKTT